MGGRRVLVAWFILSGCGGASVSSPSDVTAFQQEVASATQALDGYQVATRTMSTAADCTAAVNAYGPRMQGDLDHMMSMSGSMDDHMRSMGQASRADVGCGVQGMDDEFRRHLEAACHEADMERNREEARRHVGAMANGLQHMEMRAAQISAGMMDGGWRMWDGGMMDPDDHPMGCAGGPMMDGGVMPGPGPMMDGGTWDAGPGPMMDGGMGHMP